MPWTISLNLRFTCVTKPIYIVSLNVKTICMDKLVQKTCRNIGFKSAHLNINHLSYKVLSISLKSKK
jgi:hypothetical protein